MSSLSGVRPRRDLLELTTGFLVLAVLAGLLALAVLGRSQSGSDGYTLRAVFNQIDGLSVGSDVRLAGITVGHVTAETVDPKNYRAEVRFTVRNGIELPTDSAAIVTSDSLLGGKYIALSPGGDEKNLKPGGIVSQTQGAISLEQLLSKFIFSVTDSLDKSRKAAAQ
ncbi:outer membrane lipid asymmetry maintenance protein MlaD [Asaia sp. HN010]|uniref:outer membrane lipid asymmetry maintenance protein MlaD n=1 Tax=Asaia sp. HN010 TaxID=3081233 RepID=UPI003015E131